MHFPFCSRFEQLPLFPPSRIADCSKPLTIEKIGRGASALLSRPDHDDFGSNRSKVMNVIDSNSLARDAGEKVLTLFLIPPWRALFGQSGLKRGRRQRAVHSGGFTLSGSSVRTTLSNEL